MKQEGIPRLPDEIDECTNCGSRICPTTKKCPHCNFPNLDAYIHPWAYKLPNDEPVIEFYEEKDSNLV